MSNMQKHFVVFYSPGTFFTESTEKEIDSWDVNTAMQMATTIKERHSAVPFGFQFKTRTRTDADFDSKVTATSCMYCLGGAVETLADVEARNDPKDRILISNMRGNGWDRIIVNTNSWKITQPLNPEDIILTWPSTTTKGA